MITEDYVSFETAKLLIKKGFEGQCHFTRRETETTYGEPWSATYEKDIPIPTLQMAMKWLREVHNIVIVVTPSVSEGKYNVSIYKIGDIHLFGFDGDSLISSYEEACNIAIRYCAENLI